MGLSQEDQKKAQNLRSQVNGEPETSSEKSIQKTSADDVVSSTVNGAVGCCQGVGNSSCCQNMPLKEKVENNHIAELETCEILQKSDEENKATSSKETSHRTICGMPTWFETWERDDTYAVAAVVVAVASVAVAYSCYRQLK